jgi:hypothetical protein
MKHTSSRQKFGDIPPDDVYQVVPFQPFCSRGIKGVTDQIFSGCVLNFPYQRIDFAQIFDRRQRRQSRGVLRRCLRCSHLALHKPGSNPGHLLRDEAVGSFTIGLDLDFFDSMTIVFMRADDRQVGALVRIDSRPCHSGASPWTP